jgi:hypothetical protein
MASVMKMWNPVCPRCDLAFVGRAFTDAEVQRTTLEKVARQPRCSRCLERFEVSPLIVWQEEHGTSRFRLPLA